MATSTRTEVNVDRWFDELDAMIDASDATENEFFDHAKRSIWTRQQVLAFGPEYFYFSRSFPRVFAALIERVEYEESRFFLTQILYSELGSGEPSRMHYRLFGDTLAALGLSRAEIESGPRYPETVELVEGLRGLYRDANLARALGAQYALERQAFPMLAHLYEGFKKSPVLGRSGLEFFELHLVEEPEHYRCMRECVARSVGGSADFDLVREGVTAFLSLIAAFWRRQAREVAAASESGR